LRIVLKHVKKCRFHYFMQFSSLLDAVSGSYYRCYHKRKDYSLKTGL